MRFIGALIVWIIIAIIAFFVFAYSGVYQVGADIPHWKVTRQAIGMVRERAIDRRVADIKSPPLDDPALVKEGAEHYAEMCTGCHLAPDPAEAFWIIKHGLKMTAMPAWGKTHDDQKIWAMVAYLQKQPKMSAAEFHALTVDAAEVEDHEHAATGMVMPVSASTAH